ncbi:hypothetical protein M947_00040 [Sulfurimonas hongkongensis]|uniref:Tetratricopeptide repeat-like domain-containing protein n=1 Tax=Sulfurimonas hongkongensis TaxID=1172190 RepID=T0L472_9BACT|nr:hypothetical protein [Sulfurimonas hongkongensis]EQB40673.1 hypothetical protein M947_00040 [Sulfurimonas hongkongensis]
MSLKNDINMVREELNSEEKFFEKAVITEKFVKKYKKFLIGGLVAIVVVVAANIAYDINRESEIKEVNKALAILNEDAENSEALRTIKQISPDLYDAWTYSNAVVKKDMLSMKGLTDSSSMMVADLASYEVAQDAKDAKLLDEYASKKDAVYRDLALVQSAIIYMSKSEIQKAHERLAQISSESALRNIANALMHYGVK